MHAYDLEMIRRKRKERQPMNGAARGCDYLFVLRRKRKGKVFAQNFC